MQALQQVVGMLKPGHGRLLLRDYAAGDYAQQRFRASARRQQLDDCSFVRGDGTLACYFSEVQPAQSTMTLYAPIMSGLSPPTAAG